MIISYNNWGNKPKVMIKFNIKKMNEYIGKTILYSLFTGIRAGINSYVNYILYVTPIRLCQQDNLNQ